MATHSSIIAWRIPWTKEPGGEGNGTRLQYSCLENPMDGGAWKAAVHGVAEGWTQLSNFTLTFHFPALEKEMATHSSVLPWRIPSEESSGRAVPCGHVRSGEREAGAEGRGRQDAARPAWLEQTWEGPARLRSGRSRALWVMGFEGRTSGICSGVTCGV